MIFLGRTEIAAGLLTLDDLRTQAWQRLFQGVYADSRIEMTHYLRCAAALAYLVRPDGVIAGRSAATLYGAGLAGPTDPVEVLVRRAGMTSRHRGIRFHRGVLAPEDRQVLRGLPLTTPPRTCWDLARWLDPPEAVVLVDRMLAAGLVSPADLEAYYLRRHEEEPAPRGNGRFARVVSLVDGRSGSPQESRLRARLVMAGVPRPEPQFVVVDATGRFIARVDLAWAARRVAMEYDGLHHVGSAEQMHEDRRRLNALASNGWTVLHVTSARLRDNFDSILLELRAALRRAR